MDSLILPLYKQSDVTIVKAKDCYLYDAENNEYTDFESGDWAANLGHSNIHINETIKNQIEISIHDGLRFRNNESENLSKLLLEILNFEGGKSVFLNSGSEAVNLAIAIAKHITKREKILKLDCSYLAAYGLGHSGNLDLLNIDSLAQLETIDFSTVAAFILEP
ncbi:MAG: aminotransferase class III-fold pyridoxal phosphate-dependent enzyme [Bacteroidales bacterium]|nr:aminotransferase class III-fold pyridoxal phosphate-dependent enzyme [Bacteroidales bacterium]